MKHYLFIISLVLLTACSTLDEVNENPNNITETHPSLLLTEILSTIGQVEGTDPLYASRMIVYTGGESTHQFYKWNRGSFNDYNTLRQVQKMMEEAERIDNKSYLAIGKFLRSYLYYKLTLTFGDIPYSEALGGEITNTYQPNYDNQEAIFNGILTELQEADELLETYQQDMFSDLFYNGNTLMWRKAINSFRLKVLLTLSTKEGQSTIPIKSSFKQIYNTKPIFESNADNAMLVFVDQAGSRYTEFNDSDYGSDMFMSKTFVDLLRNLEDPRLFVFVDRTPKAKENGLAIDNFEAYAGGDPIADYAQVKALSADGLLSKVNPRYHTNPTTEPSIVLGYSELQFILAEAAVRGWITGNAETFYNKGVQANFQFYANYASDYAAYIGNNDLQDYLENDAIDLSNASSNEEKIKRIITQKYIGSFLQGGWTMYFEYLRTGYPHFTHPSGTTPPTRWMYPLSELQNNAANVEQAIANQFGAGNDGIRQNTWWLN